MTEHKANIIYTVLVSLGGANENERPNFIFHHTKNNPCTEWRFQGKLGFGGKYRSKTNTVDCYSEDLTPEIQETIDIINNHLNHA